MSFLYFGHDLSDGIQCESAFLTQLFHALRLGKGGCCLRHIHGFHKDFLFFGFQVGQFHSRIEGYLLLIHHFQKVRDQIGKPESV